MGGGGDTEGLGTDPGLRGGLVGGGAICICHTECPNSDKFVSRPQSNSAFKCKSAGERSPWEHYNITMEMRTLHS